MWGISQDHADRAPDTKIEFDGYSETVLWNGSGRSTRSIRRYSYEQIRRSSSPWLKEGRTLCSSKSPTPKVA